MNLSLSWLQSLRRSLLVSDQWGEDALLTDYAANFQYLGEHTDVPDHEESDAPYQWEEPDLPHHSEKSYLTDHREESDLRSQPFFNLLKYEIPQFFRQWLMGYSCSDSYIIHNII